MTLLDAEKRDHVQRFRGGLVFKAHSLLYHSTLGLRVIKKKKKKTWVDAAKRKRRGDETPSGYEARGGCIQSHPE